MTPTQPARRLHTIDAVRAVALLGVLVMNWQSMAGLEFMSVATFHQVQGPLDRAVDVVLQVLVDKKALSAFSFLFGLSFTLLLDGVRRRGQPFLPLYARRLAMLAVFGAINFTFLYWGDILITYAVLGALLLTVVRLPQPLVLALAVVLLAAVPPLMGLVGVADTPEALSAADQRALVAFGEGSYADVIAYDVRRYLGLAGVHSPLADWNFVNVFGLFLLGLWTGRAGIAHDVAGHAPLLRRVVWVTLPLGLGASVALEAIPDTSPWATAMLLGRPVLAVAYLAMLALAFETPRWHRLRGALAPVGRMALTNYLAYGLLGQLVFYGWALDLMGVAGTADVTALALLTFGLLAVACRLWLKRWRMGPAEWAWRCVTHLEVRSNRRSPPPPAAPLPAARWRTRGRR